MPEIDDLPVASDEPIDEGVTAGGAAGGDGQR
jgi:hypothetical protein